MSLAHDLLIAEFVYLFIVGLPLLILGLAERPRYAWLALLPGPGFLLLTMVARKSHFRLLSPFLLLVLPRAAIRKFAELWTDVCWEVGQDEFEGELLRVPVLNIYQMYKISIRAFRSRNERHAIQAASFDD